MPLRACSGLLKSAPCHRKSTRLLAAVSFRQFSQKHCLPSPRILSCRIASSSSWGRTLHVDHHHHHHEPSTIFAVSTAAGRAAIAIVRISGSACAQIYTALCLGKPLPRARRASIRTLYEPENVDGLGKILDSEVLVLYFPAPKTVTGEDVLEFHVHGGPAVVKAVLKAIEGCSSPELPVEYAAPGEFTRRAFFNNRLDLTRVEALGEVLSAATEEQRRLAVQGTVSGLGKRYESWKESLLQARGELEALIDFQEDQHFDESPAGLASSVAAQVEGLMTLIAAHCDNAVRGELLRNGIQLALVGSPNAGKSSLLNRLVGRDAAIVSTEAGTTRDVVEVGVDIGGFFCRLGDTAGLRESQSHAGAVGDVEREGMRRSRERALASDVVVLVLAIEPSADGQGAHLQLDPEVIGLCKDLLTAGKKLIVAVNKMDNYGERAPAAAEHVISGVKTALPELGESAVFCLSCTTAEGIQSFLSRGLIGAFQALTRALHSDSRGLESRSEWEESLGATARQRSLLEMCLVHLREFVAAARPGWDTSADGAADGAADVDVVVAAESLRRAAECLAKITGRGTASDVEEVLGVVFEKFCVGK